MKAHARFALLALSLVTSAGCGGNSNSAMPGPTPGRTFTPGPVNAVRVSSDPFSNAGNQHATEVEPQIVSSGLTLVAAFQQGRNFNAGSSDIGFATSSDGGMTWTAGSIPGTTPWSPSAGPYDSVSDPSVAYDAKHAVWLIASLPIFFSNASTPAALISRSLDGINWNLPVPVAPAQPSNDKDWVTCDDTPSSTFYGHCYVEWDDPLNSGLIHMSTSADGGQTWSAPANTANNADGIGGQPLVQPNGTVIVPINDNTQSNMLSFRSLDGGATWSAAMPFAAISDHLVAGGMRTSPLPSGAIDAAGNVYLAWQDCRFRTGCSANDIVISTTSNGVSWSAPARVPIDATTSGVDH
ncbi:MAG: exo-alpha-sialidase, partial [Candidatus Eremiobacteraeota bacterium]|nr:exo-alpha-sialidase [Candidatus Eremiobacteraeota bacterium]